MPWTRASVSVVALCGFLLLLFLLLPQTILTIFAGLLLAILFRSCGSWISRRLHIRPAFGVSLFLVGALVLIAAVGMAFAPSVSEQLDTLWREVPATADDLTSRIQSYEWGRQVLNRLDAGALFSSASGDAATRAVGSLFGSLGNTVLLLFIALYGAFDPGTYRRGLLKLLAPSLRPRADEVLSNGVDTLRNWLAAQLISMTVVGVLTGLGLWFIGIPLALLLGLIAGLLAFIPNLGPVLAAAPGILLAVPDGLHTMLLVVGVYVAVQTVESYMVTPMVQKEKVKLPPILVICSQLIFGALFGMLGLALATPLTAVFMQLTKDLYISDYLEQEPRQAGEGG